MLNIIDNNYFYIYNCEDLQRYPKVYKDAQLSIDCVIKKIVKSTEDEFICMGVIGNYGYEIPEGNLEDFEEKELFIIKIPQLDERFIVNDEIMIYGTYNGVEEYQIDGKTYTVPVINSFREYRVGYENKFSLEEITRIAKYIFGNEIKITEPEDTQEYGFSAEEPMYLVTLDNQTNANFKQFVMMKDTGYIGYTNQNYETTYKNLFIGADFNHYIVTTYEQSIKKLYIDYYDHDLKKVWGREFDYKTNLNVYTNIMDYTSSMLAMVINSDLYLIDLKTGENIIEPILVGEKNRVSILEDKILLIGTDNKDAFMLVDNKGNIIKKIDADTGMNKILMTDIQIVNDKIVIMIGGYENDNVYDPYYYYGTYLKKYVILDREGNVELSTKDARM